MGLTMSSEEANWLNGLMQASAVAKDRDGNYPSWREVRKAFPGTSDDMTSFMQQPSWKRIRAAGLLLV